MRKTLIAALLLPLLLLACKKDARPLLNGRVEAYLTDLGPRAGGRLVELKVHEGQRVKAGDLLARVAAEELDAAVLQDLRADALRSDHGRAPGTHQRHVPRRAAGPEGRLHNVCRLLPRAHRQSR